MGEIGTMERRYAVPPSTLSEPATRYRTTEDLHAWSIYRQNLNSDFTDSALGASEKSQPPFGNFQLRESTVQTILNHPKYGPRERQSELGNNIFSYLRFGLPRVFPPSRVNHDGSSGYDSSDDGSPCMDGRRARSDPDFRNHVIRQDNHEAETSFVRPERRLKASSEADLLSHEIYNHQDGRNTKQRVMRAQHESRDGYNRDPMPGAIGHLERRSHAGSHISLISRSSRARQEVHGDARSDGFYGHDTPILNDKFFPKDTFYSTLPSGESGNTPLKHPHLQVRDLAYEIDRSSSFQRLCGGARTKMRLLDGLSFEVRGGEILAIMATTTLEGTTILNILANQYRKWQCHLYGDIIVNGLHMTPPDLEHCVAYIQKDSEFSPDMSVRQTLLFTSLLQEPSDSNRNRDTKGRINALLEDLGLGQVKHTRVHDLTESEKRRLNVACRLMLDTDIVLLDQPTKGMDIFDSFFLVEYLRQWASRGRIVILTIHPPTYEIFTMISRVALVSTGRMLYHGKRKDMLTYFAYIDLPCPAYKNPSDYYLDLVTLDNLSPEAMLESSQRIENLIEIFRRRQEALSDPGPPAMPPSTVKRANFFTQVLALWIRVLIYMFPYNILHFVSDVFLSSLMSILVGVIYWKVRGGLEQEFVLDRIGVYYVIMGVALLPMMLNYVTDVWRDKASVSRDFRDGLYSRFAYIMSKVTYSLPPAAAVCLSYIVPVYSIAGLDTDARVNSFGVYIGYNLLYLLTIRMLFMALGWMFSSRHLAAGLGGIILTLCATTAGYTVHFTDLSLVLSWFQWVSPMRWMMEQIVRWEFTGKHNTIGNVTKYFCTRNPVIQQENSILVKADCGILSDIHALRLHQYRTTWPLYLPIIVTLAFHLAWFLIGLFAFFMFNQQPKQTRKRTAV
ncbi:LOW QUALITY PROTEIN: ATP-binding cassette sub-family G member 8-like [Tachypleus tridentatus]|uniref:LOW QUALITY PROTEIN: ATP-binding cassette sub-family G member 8-like n=1 Tax=Tachypleus tridentatus TaxID=6853 RepID=UPI003FD08756